jgi:hypothetical protein
MRRRAAAVLIVLAAMTAGPGAFPASPAHAANSGLGLLLPVIPAMLPGQQGWIGTTWIASDDVCDVEVTASGPGVTVSYPSNTATYSSLFQNSSLLDGGIDFTAFNFTLSAAATGSVPITLRASYRIVPNGHAGDATWCKGAARTTTTETATMSVKSYTGPAFTQKTTALTVAQRTPAWAALSFAGYLPGLTAFKVALTPPSGMTVTYPGSAPAAGLNSGAALPVGYEDYAAVHLDATGMRTGTYTVPITVTSGAGTAAGSVQLTVS